METKANYAVVGLFTILVLASAFGFVYWMTNYGDAGDVAPLNVRIPGSANGLSVGSAVRFNGISIGTVRGLSIDQEDPSFVVARTDVRADAPVTTATEAVLAIQGLTGSAYIEMSAGDMPGDNILREAMMTGEPAVLTADPSSVTNLLATADEILSRANEMVGELEGFVSDAREPLTNTVRNTEAFSQALTDNAQGIDQFLQSVAGLSDTFNNLSGTLDTTLTAAADLMQSVDPEKIDSILDNVDVISSELAVASRDVSGVIDTVQSAAADVQRLTTAANESMARVDGIIAGLDGIVTDVGTVVSGVDADQIARLVDNAAAASETIAVASEDARGAIADAQDLVARFAARGDDIDGLISDVVATGDQLSGVVERVDGVIAKVDTALGEGEINDLLAQVEQAVSSFNEVASAIDAATIDSALGDIAAASQSARNAAADAEALTGSFAAREDDIDAFITDVTQLAERLNAASVRVDDVLAKVDGFLGEGDASNLMSEAEATIVEFRQLAEGLNAQVGPITANLQRFSGRGLRDIEALVAETRRSISSIERTISDFEENPQRLIFGGEEVREFDGRIRR